MATEPEREWSRAGLAEHMEENHERLKRVLAESTPANDPDPRPDRPRLGGTLGVRWS